MRKSTSTDETIRWGDKEFQCPHEVSLDDLDEILSQWQNGEVSAEDVLNFAEGLSWIGGGWPTYPRRDPRSILFAILQLLEFVYTNPVLPSDIPALRSFLSSARSEPVKTWKRMDEYWASIDRDDRIERRRTDEPE